MKVSSRTPPPPDMGWAYFLDIDGTLTELADTLRGIVIHHDLAELIGRLRSLTGGAVALITGRTIAEVDGVISLSGFPVAGHHGLEVRTAGGKLVAHPVREGSLDELRLAAEQAVRRHDGLTVEFKGLSIALHYRQAPKLAGYSHKLMRSLRARYVPDFVLQKGKMILELRPAGRDKGGAIAELMESPPFAGRIPVFVGDDVADEAGFAIVNEMGGHSIKVGPGRTEARYRLRDVAAVRDWMARGIDTATEAAAEEIEDTD
ncbi:MAG: trehalose-phosphatase [Gemmatimonadales bacterium]